RASWSAHRVSPKNDRIPPLCPKPGVQGRAGGTLRGFPLIEIGRAGGTLRGFPLIEIGRAGGTLRGFPLMKEGPGEGRATQAARAAASPSVFTTSTAHDAARTTRSATLPMMT